MTENEKLIRAVDEICPECGYRISDHEPDDVRQCAAILGREARERGEGICQTERMKANPYERFLEAKQKRILDKGFVITDTDLNPKLFPFQKWIVTQALKKGRYAVFADCGTGKTIIQLEWADHVSRHTEKPVIILAPLAVSAQTIREGVKFGYRVEKYTDQAAPGIYITNYEQIDNLDPDIFGGIVLDESSILKNFNGVYKTRLIESFAGTQFKLCLTATPSPNDVMELGNHAEFLGVMSRNEMLAMYFVHDGGDTAKWRIKKHAERLFWSWVSEWALYARETV